MEILDLIIGALLGALVGFLIGRNRNSESSEHQKTIDQLRNELNKLQTEQSQLLQNLSATEARLETKQEHASHQEKLLELEQKKLEDSRNELTQLKTELSSLKANNSNLEQQKKELENIKQKFTEQFEHIATKLLQHNSKELSDTNQRRITQLLEPFREQIKNFEHQVRSAYEQEGKEKASLKTEINKLHELNQQLSQDAANLTNALKGDTKKQGDWGEIILERVLERSGLIKGEEYETQFSDKNEDGQTIRPDVIVHLPDDKHVVIDAKVSLTAYNAFANAEDTDQQQAALKAHVTSVRNHINTLSGKAYQTADSLNSPDFVLLFMPIEPAFGVAIQNDPDLFSYAWDRHIVIVSPSTLLATLRTIASIWKQERQNRNVMEIARLGGDIHDKLASSLNELEKIDEDFGKMHEKYKAAFKRLYTGKGNVIRTAEKMHALGAKTRKSLPTLEPEGDAE